MNPFWAGFGVGFAFGALVVAAVVGVHAALVVVRAAKQADVPTKVIPPVSDADRADEVRRLKAKFAALTPDPTPGRDPKGGRK